MTNGILISTLAVTTLFILGVILTMLSLIFQGPIRFVEKEIVKEIAKIISPKDKQYIVDLSSADGRVLIALSKLAKIKGLGMEISPIIVMISKFNKYLSFRTTRGITFDVLSKYHIDLKDADTIFCYESSDILSKLDRVFKKEMTGKMVYTYKYEISGKRFDDRYQLSNSEYLYKYVY